MEKTLVLIKPNGVASGLIGTILQRYETSRFAVVGLKVIHATKEKVGAFYAEHKGQYFYERLVQFMSSGPIVAVVLQGVNTIESVRAINGNTDPEKAQPGTIRYDFAPAMNLNVVHASDSKESAEREIDFWFEESEIVNYHPASFKTPQ